MIARTNGKQILSMACNIPSLDLLINHINTRSFWVHILMALSYHFFDYKYNIDGFTSDFFSTTHIVWTDTPANSNQ